MSIFRQLSEKPWQSPQGVVLEPALVGGEAWPKAKLGLCVFLSVATVLFFLLIIAYAGRMAGEDLRPGPEPGLLWFNTIALICCSIAMQGAAVAARRGRVEDTWSGLLAGGLLAIVFLIGQLIAWLQLSAMGALGLRIPAVAFFYLISGVHALHITGGLVAWAITAKRILRGHGVADVRQSIELCTLYWHFMLGVWIVLFGLLFSGNNLSAVLAFCGLR